MHPSGWMCPGPTQRQPVGASCLPLGQTTAAPGTPPVRAGSLRMAPPARQSRLPMSPAAETPEVHPGLTGRSSCMCSGRKPDPGSSGGDQREEGAGTAQGMCLGYRVQVRWASSLSAAGRASRTILGPVAPSCNPHPASRIPQPASQGEGARSRA